MVGGDGHTADLQAAYLSCAATARAHYENFPVASMLVPRPMRRHVAAVYAFARAADDFADEGTRSADERYQLLDGWTQRLRHAVASPNSGSPRRGGEPANTIEIFLALGESIRSVPLPVAPFEDLISAFRQDVGVTRYSTWADLFDYCRRSANPIGRLVLRIAGRDDERLDTWSDAMCTALQLTNFWQDLKIDFDRGRIYVPEEERLAFGAHEDDLSAGRMTAGWRQALQSGVARTRRLFADGRPLCDAIHGRLRFELRGTWLGGIRILDRLEHARFDVVGRRPTLGAADALWIAPRLLIWNRRSTRQP